MSILTLDLSLTAVGWSKFSKSGALLDKGRIIPKEDLPNTAKICYIIDQLKPKYVKVDNVVIEDVYYGGNSKTLIWLARLGGAVAYSWFEYSYKIPLWMTAIHARSLVDGIKGNSKKPEIQCFVLEKYGMLSTESIAGYKSQITKLKNAYKAKEITKYRLASGLTKVSTNIEIATGLSNDEADSIILGLAFQEEYKK